MWAINIFQQNCVQSLLTIKKDYILMVFLYKYWIWFINPFKQLSVLSILNCNWRVYYSTNVLHIEYAMWNSCILRHVFRIEWYSSSWLLIFHINFPLTTKSRVKLCFCRASKSCAGPSNHRKIGAVSIEARWLHHRYQIHGTVSAR